MKRSVLPLSFAALALSLALPLAHAQTQTPKNKAQALVEQVIAQNPSVMIFGMHAIAPGTDYHAIIASNLGRIGKKDDDDDVEAFTKNKPVFEPVKEKQRYEVLIPLYDKANETVGVLGIVFHWYGDDEKHFVTDAARIRDGLKDQIASLDDLFSPADPRPLLVEGPTVTIPDSKGKFDFLEVDTVNHRLLAAHEKDGTADFIDLNTNQLLTRLPTGPAVHIVLDPKLGKYFISASEDKKIVIVDAATLKITGSIATDGELDAILYDPKADRIYVTNDESTHVWAIDPNAEKVVATIDIPGAPEYMLYDADADRIYLNIKATNEVLSIDPNSNAIVAHWPTAPAVGPHGLAFDPATGRVFSAGMNGQLSAIDVKTGKVIGSSPIAKMVDQAVYDSSLRRIYCACTGTMSVVQETDTGLAPLGDVPTTATAKNVAIDPATRSVWTTYTDGTNSYAKSWHLPQ